MSQIGNKPIPWIKRNIIPIFLTILSIYFVFSGTIKVGTQKLNWVELVLFVCTTLIFGVVISSLVAETGYTDGKKDPNFIATRTLAVEWSNKVLPMRDEAELYANDKIKEGIKEDRSEILALAGLKYEEIFNEEGIYILKKSDYKKLKRKQKNAVLRSKMIKKEDFTLFGFASGKLVGRKKAPNETDRRKKKTFSLFAIRIVIAIATGSIMFYYVGISYGAIVYAIYQLLIWFGSGFVSRIGNFNFIVVEMKEYDQDRIWYLKSFYELPNDEQEKYCIRLGKEPRHLLKIENTNLTPTTNE